MNLHEKIDEARAQHREYSLKYSRATPDKRKQMVDPIAERLKYLLNLQDKIQALHKELFMKLYEDGTIQKLMNEKAKYVIELG